MPQRSGCQGPSPAPPTHPLPNARPPPKNRSFVSPAIERRLSFLVHNKTWRDPNLATMLWNCLPNTLDTTVWAAPAGSGFQPPAEPNPQSFVSTGDQASMYLRDSQNQVMPYVRFAKEEPEGIGAFLVRAVSSPCCRSSSSACLESLPMAMASVPECTSSYE